MNAGAEGSTNQARPRLTINLAEARDKLRDTIERGQRLLNYGQPRSAPLPGSLGSVNQ
jgi:hypothetical protein